jgi:hypothetical protein
MPIEDTNIHPHRTFQVRRDRHDVLLLGHHASTTKGSYVLLDPKKTVGSGGGNSLQIDKHMLNPCRILRTIPVSLNAGALSLMVQYECESTIKFYLQLHNIVLSHPSSWKPRSHPLRVEVFGC